MSMPDNALESAPPAAPPAPAKEPAWMRWIGIAVFVAAIGVGAWLRFRVLDLKPLHSDEGVNGWFLMRLYNGLELGNFGVNYRYDPTNYHGPFLYFAGLLPFLLLGPSSITLRLLMALAGTGCIGILWAVRRHLSWAGLAMAAWLIAISPPLVYFSRTAIHEIFVCFFALSAVACFVRCYEGSWKKTTETFRANWLLFAVVSCALLFTNKETSIITFASFVGAAAVAWFFSRTTPEEIPAPTKADKKKYKSDSAAPEPGGPGFGAVFVRHSAAIAIALGPVVILLLKVKGKRSWDFLTGTQQNWIYVAAAFGVVSAIGWLAGTRGETFQLRARIKRLAVIASPALGGFAFLVMGPLLLLRYLTGFMEKKGETPSKPSGIAATADRMEARLVKRFQSTFEHLSDYALAYAWGAALVVILFTSFFNNPKGAWDMFATYGTWVGRGHEGAGHDKAFGYWIELMWEFDTPILLMGMLGTAVALFRRDRFGLFVSSWAWSQWLVYSVISYKTPWLNLNFTVPLALTAGLALREIAGGPDSAVGTLLRSVAPKMPAAPWVGSAVVTAAVPFIVVTWPVPAGPVLSPKDPNANVSWWALGWDTNFVHYDDDRYAIIYVQTVREFEGLVDRVDTLLDKHGEKLGVWVTSGDYWPMPFYLREWDKTVGYYQGKIPSGDTPSVVVTASTQEAEMRDSLAGYRRVPFMLRPGVALSLFVEPSVYDPVFGPPPGETPPEPAPEDPALRKPGLVAEYRYGIGCTGEVLSRRVDPVPYYGGKDREFRAPLCVIWKGFLNVVQEGEYAFGTSSDDGSWVYVDGKLVVDNGGTHGAVDREGVLRVLSPGLHPIEVRYFDAGGGAALDVWIRKRDEKRGSLDSAGGLFHDVRWLEQPIQKAAAPRGKASGVAGSGTPELLAP